MRRCREDADRGSRKCCLLVALAAPALALLTVPAAAGGATFESGPCPKTPEPIEEQLKNARCGFLVVPESRARDSSRLIRLAVAIVPAESSTPAPDPVAFMAGGPGITAFTQVRGARLTGMNRKRDVIFMEQRGTRYNEPHLSCPEIDRFKARAVGLRSYGDSARRQFVEATRKCRQRLAAKEIDLSAYNTSENAADFADLRVALGLARWNVYGGSYGTDLALTYMRDHPQGVRSVTVDSVVPPDIASLAWTWTSVGEGVSNLFRACRAQRRCAERYPRLERTFTRLVRELEAEPLTTRVKPEGGDRVKVVLDGGALVNWITDATTSATVDVPATIDALARGRPREIAEARAAGADEGLAHGMTNGVLCSEWVPYERPSEILAQGRREFPGFPDSVLAQAPGLTFTADGCRAWNVPKAPASIRARARSTIPTLVLGGSFDALTGARWARYVSRQLTSSTLVIVPGVGHGALFRDPCPKRVFASFLADPSGPDTSCVPRIRPAPKFTIAPSR